VRFRRVNGIRDGDSRQLLWWIDLEYKCNDRDTKCRGWIYFA
jgi:hypothetical protein